MKMPAADARRAGVIELNLGGTKLAAGKPALINSAFGLALVFIGTPVYFFYRARRESGPNANC